MTRVDWIALAIAALAALGGLRRGLIATALSFAGLAAGAVIGARLAPHFLHGGSSSPYTPLAGLVGALVGAAVLQAVASLAGSFARGGALRVIPPLRLLDSIGGLLAGAALGFATRVGRRRRCCCSSPASRRSARRCSSRRSCSS